jgi:hypothetical protein
MYWNAFGILFLHEASTCSSDDVHIWLKERSINANTFLAMNLLLPKARNEFIFPIQSVP